MKAQQITMLEIGKTLVSLDIIEKQFHCDLSKCNGACCVVGESGAPLEENEKELIADTYPLVREYMHPEGIQAVEEQGWYVIDDDGDTVTPLINDGACAYAYNVNGVTLCAIEKAWFEKKIDFRKPVSCHLYPVRITSYKSYDAANYEKNKICKAALKMGRQQEVYLYKFLKDALVRKYGEQWYAELEENARVWFEQNALEAQ
ncbi:MAG: DUF3109 family protein [Salinivirgaceae bacterium]|nr:DUF3109 family protein [Salinivirgaceae bacterium]